MNIVTVLLPFDLDYWGFLSDANMTQFLDKLEVIISSEYAYAPFKIQFQRINKLKTVEVHGHDQEVTDSIYWFFRKNWVRAL